MILSTLATVFHELTRIALAAIGFFISSLMLYLLISSVFSKDYRSPSDGRYHLVWSVKVFISNFSRRASERWYESITRYRQNAFVSLASALGLVYVVEVLFLSTDDYCSYKPIRYHYHGFRSFDSLKKLMRVTRQLYDSKDEKYPMFESLSVAGYGVVEHWSAMEIT